MTALSVVRAAALEAQPPAQRWLVEGLWAARAVGIVGGEPKCCKSFLALDLAVAVASGTPALRRFPVREPGPVLLYAAEDALTVVRRRLEGIAQAAGVSFDDLDVYVITAPTLRLDLERDRDALTATVERLHPRLVVLDPFVRMHRVDENAAQDVAPLLAYLRELERRYAAAVVLVHHARKSAAALRAGQALRGSSELHAWGDSNLYLRRRGELIDLTVEHRAAGGAALSVALVERDGGLALETIVAPDTTAPAQAPRPLAERIDAALRQAGRPLTLHELRAACQVRMATMLEELARTTALGRLRKIDGRYELTRP